MPRHPPSARNRAIARRCAEGATLRAVSAEFRLSAKRVREISDAVEQHDRGAAILAFEPTSLEGLELVGKIPHLTRVSLQARGITRLEDLQSLSLADLIKMPNIGRRYATTLIDLCAATKRM
jgi:hypothetical protein